MAEEKMEEIFRIIGELDDLDKEAWMEVIKKAETEMGDALEKLTDEGFEETAAAWDIMSPYVRIIRMLMASPVMTRDTRTRMLKAIIMETSGLLSPIEVAGTLWSIMFRCFCSPARHMPSAIFALPFRLPPEMQEDKDKSRTVV